MCCLIHLAGWVVLYMIKMRKKIIIINKSCGNVVSKVKQNTGCIFRLEN